MNVAQLLNYYPKYQYLDDILTASGKKKLTLYIDIKGCMGSLYQEWAVKYIIEQSRNSTADPSIFASCLEFIAFHKLYAKKRHIDLEMVFFYESGSSAYHADILSSYKGNRDLGSFFDLDSTSLDLFQKVKDKNLDLIDKICNKIPNVSVVRLKFLEADFIPWYVQRRVLEPDPDSVNVIYSLDKDMLQCLDENTYVFWKNYKAHKIIAHDNVYNHYLKTEVPWQADPEMFFMVLAIDGDIADNFKGVKGIGTKTIIKSFPELLQCVGTAKQIAENIVEGKTIFTDTSSSNKAIQKIIANEEIVVRNIKLASYRVLSDYLDSGYPLVNVKRKKYINETVNSNHKIRNGNVLYEALDKMGMNSLVQEQSVYNLFS